MNKNQISLEGEITKKDPKITLENPENILSEFGLSENQSKVYFHLNKFGSKSASNLSKILGIPRTEIYAILKILQKKGCIRIKNEKPMKFNPVPFEQFLESIIIAKKNEIQKLEKIITVIKTLKFPQMQ